MFDRMSLARYFELGLMDAIQRKETNYLAYLSSGQEAVAAALSCEVRDYMVFAQHRAHDIYLAFGGRPEALRDELLGLPAGTSGGRAGSNCIQCHEGGLTMFGHHGLIGENVPQGVGAALASGNIEQAEALLGRAFVIAGRVMDGKKIGRTIGFPTANIQVRRKRLPLSGVFAVTVSGVAAQPLAGAANIGVRPTVAEGLKPVLEVHLLDFDRDIYGTHVDVNFMHKLRDEAKFDSLDALKAQIARDVADVRTYFKTHSTPMASMTRSET